MNEFQFTFSISEKNILTFFCILSTVLGIAAAYFCFIKNKSKRDNELNETLYTWGGKIHRVSYYKNFLCIIVNNIFLVGPFIFTIHKFADYPFRAPLFTACIVYYFVSIQLFDFPIYSNIYKRLNAIFDSGKIAGYVTASIFVLNLPWFFSLIDSVSIAATQKTNIKTSAAVSDEVLFIAWIVVTLLSSLLFIIPSKKVSSNMKNITLEEKEQENGTL